MSLLLTPLYEAAVRRFATSSAVDRFNDDFLFCTNRALDELNLFLATEIAHVADQDATIDELDAGDEGILFAGICAHLADMGHNLRGGEVQYIEIKEAWETAKGSFLQKQIAAASIPVDSRGVPTADIIGLGHKGTRT